MQLAFHPLVSKGEKKHFFSELNGSSLFRFSADFFTEKRTHKFVSVPATFLARERGKKTTEASDKEGPGNKKARLRKRGAKEVAKTISF